MLQNKKNDIMITSINIFLENKDTYLELTERIFNDEIISKSISLP